MAAEVSGEMNAPHSALRKLRYVGALSSTLERAPLPQKNRPGVGWPNWAALAWSQSSAGIIVAKIPANSRATYLMGAKLKSLASWTGLAVVR